MWQCVLRRSASSGLGGERGTSASGARLLTGRRCAMCLLPGIPEGKAELRRRERREGERGKRGEGRWEERGEEREERGGGEGSVEETRRL